MEEFFSGVTINERTNLKLQTQIVPLIYRTYMSEFLYILNNLRIKLKYIISI